MEASGASGRIRNSEWGGGGVTRGLPGATGWLRAAGSPAARLCLQQLTEHLMPDCDLDPTTDPVVYVIRHPDGYALYPFKDDISERLKVGTMNAAQTLLAIAYLDVSLIVSDCGGDVLWRHGADVTAANLEAMAIKS